MHKLQCNQNKGDKTSIFTSKLPFSKIQLMHPFTSHTVD